MSRQDYPEQVETVEQLEELLSRPTPELVEFVRSSDGDILVLGATGKVGPTLCRMAKRAMEQANVRHEVIGVARRTSDTLETCGVRTLACDLLDPRAVDRLPDARNVIYMVGRKFGSTGNEHMTWAMNVLATHNAAGKYAGSRVVAFSTGCVYPLADMAAGGCTEDTPPAPIGEYAMSCLGRERVWDYFSHAQGTKVVHIRLNYAVDLRYGVLVDIGRKIFHGEPVDLTTSHANAIWQGDACNQILRSLSLASSPPAVLNVTGPETFSIREVALEFGKLFGKEPRFQGNPSGKAYLSNAARANGLFGPPRVSLGRIIKWVARWIQSGGELWDKPTHFETQDGNY
jgi:nucleoside-diphosphate-sugar epimerase